MSVKQIRYLANHCLLALCLALMLYPATVLAAQPWQARHDQAIELARGNDFKQALAIMAELRNRYPNAAPLWVDSALVLHWSGDDKAATDLYETKLRQRNDLPAYLKEAMANAYYRSGVFAEARTLYKQLGANGERRFRMMEAQSLIRMNNPAESENIYRGLLKEKPDDPDVYLSRGDARLVHGDYHRAIEDFLTVKALMEKNPDADKTRKIDSLLAAAYIRASDSARAIVALEPYILNGTADIVMQADYVFAFRQNGSFEKAVDAARRLWPDLNKPPVYGVRVLGDSYLRLGDYPQAIQIYAVVLRRDPTDHFALLGSALASGLTGKIADALVKYDQVIAKDPRLAELVLDDCLYFVSLGKTWSAQRIFEVITKRIPNNAAFHRQYADRLALSGLPRAAYDNYQILRGLPGGAAAGAAGMSKAATATGDYAQAKALLNALDKQTLRTPMAAQALREYEERKKGSLNSSAVLYQDYRNKADFLTTTAFEASLGGNISLLGQTTRLSLRNTETGEGASYWAHGAGVRIRGIKYDFKALWDQNNIANMDGNQFSLDLFPNDKATVNFFSTMSPMDTAEALNQRIMARTYGGSYSWRRFATPSPGGTILRVQDYFTVGYSESSLTDGNKSNNVNFNWDRLLRDDRFKRLTWSTYLSRQRYAFSSPYYYSPGLRHTIGTGLTERTYVKRGYWEWKAFVEFGGAQPFPWDFSPFVRLEYGHFFTSLLFATAGCEYGFSTKNEQGNPAIGFGRFQCDLNINLLW